MSPPTVPEPAVQVPGEDVEAATAELAKDEGNGGTCGAILTLFLSIPGLVGT